jgi:hypothetical protein
VTTVLPVFHAAAPALPLPPLPHLNPTGAILSAIGRVLTSGVQSIATAAFDRMTQALLATTEVRLDGWFTAPWRAMIAVAAVMALPILLAGVATEVLAGRPGMAVRRGVLLPLLIGPTLLAARAVLGLLLAVVNGACALVVQLGVGGPAGFASALNRMRGVLGVAVGPAPVPGTGGVTSVLIILVTAFLCFVIWIELALRAALVYLLVAFIPLSLAGLFWTITSRWTRRLLEILAAVVLAQLVITVVMVLAAAALADHPDGLAAGVDQTAVGLALLFLGTLGLPMTFRLIPHVLEASVAAGTGAAVAGRMRQHGGQMLAAVPHPAAQLAGSAAAGRYGAAAGAARRLGSGGSAAPAAAGSAGGRAGHDGAAGAARTQARP